MGTYINFTREGLEYDPSTLQRSDEEWAKSILATETTENLEIFLSELCGKPTKYLFLLSFRNQDFYQLSGVEDNNTINR